MQFTSYKTAPLTLTGIYASHVFFHLTEIYTEESIVSKGMCKIISCTVFAKKKSTHPQQIFEVTEDSKQAVRSPGSRHTSEKVSKEISQYIEMPKN